MNTRFFVSKKEAYRIEAKALLDAFRHNLNINELKGVTLYNIYDVFNAELNDIELLKTKVCAEVVTDDVIDELDLSGLTYIAYESLPGQYDQRNDSAQACLMLLNNKSDVIIKSGRIVILDGEVSETSINKIKHYLINPVEMREKDLSILVNDEDVTIDAVPIVEGFTAYNEAELKVYHDKMGLAMSNADLKFIQDYFNEEEHRDPSETEIRVLDTYWSDHCRHTTFETILKDVKFEAGKYQEQIQAAYEKFIKLHQECNRADKPITLMNMATIAGKYMRKAGKLDDMEVSEEINACSVEIKVDVDGKDEDWLLMFKNETHNHPTEIEPFGGASTCIGGAIRDPLSGRSYVYQAMRITGSGDINKPIDETLANKLPQSVISKSAAHGYSSYGNQIGLATTYVKEIYNEGYVAKRMEVGAVVGAAPKANVIRKSPCPGDVVVLLGGATGRDGIGGATGSSKEHNSTSLSKCSSEVQKGNAPMERRLQRLFRNPECTRLIKKANDFGAGGVSVAIGELADGIEIDLDKVPVKYAGLNGTELAISESQERMACVIDPSDYEAFKELAYQENLDTTLVAKVSAEPRLVMNFHGEKLVNIARRFLDTNGVRCVQDVTIADYTDQKEDPFKHVESSLCEMLAKPNNASQRGLVEMFDASIGKSTVLMPYGGKYQLSESEASVQKLPVFGMSQTCSIMSYGYHPLVSIYSPYLGSQYSVVEALARLVAVGATYRNARLTNQEYFERLNQDAQAWGKPTQALLGLIEAQLAFETPAIGGKDSMSGTYNDIHVPPTLITFAVAHEKVDKIISSEFKAANHKLYLVKHQMKPDYTIDYAGLKDNFDRIKVNADAGKIAAMMTLKSGGLAEAVAKMSFGNKIGAHIKTDEPLYDLSIGSILVEASEDINDDCFKLVGMTTSEALIDLNGDITDIDKAITAWEKTYQRVYPPVTDMDKTTIDTPLYENDKPIKAKKHYDEVKVIIPVFPGNNCEYDCAAAFNAAGATPEIYVFNNLSVENIKRSIRELSEKIANAQILMIPGGFTSGDEPDGSGKFIANVLMNEQVNAAVKTLLANDGLILGICNGFQALVKAGLLPYGDISMLNADNPTLFRNNINRHVSHIASTRVTSNKSPWLKNFKPGQVHQIAMSHGEGRFVADEATATALFANGQVATQYVDDNQMATMNGAYNINGSTYAIEGITSADGRIFGKMGHSERYEEGLFKNIYGDKMQNIFKNGVDYFKK